MKIINGKNLILGRLASFVAKAALKGENVVVLNCSEVIISGRKDFIKKSFEEKRKKGSKGSLKGPKIPRESGRIVKRVIRGMLPNHRSGRGKEAYKRIQCYKDFPKEFEKEKIEKLNLQKKIKHIKVKELEK